MIEQILNQIANNLVALAQIISSIVIAITLFLTVKNYLKTQIKEQVKMAHDFYNRYDDLVKENAELTKQGKVRDERRDWAARYCRLVEWFSFLVNTKQITDSRLLGFYENIIISTYEDVIPFYLNNDQVDKGAFYPEVYELYENLKKGEIKVDRSHQTSKLNRNT